MVEGDLDQSEPRAFGGAARAAQSTVLRRSVRTLAVGIMIGAVGALVLAISVGGPLAVGHRADFPLERIYGGAAVSLAARLNAGNQTNPLAQDNRALGRGRNAYTGSCAQCHGANGNGKGVFGKATYPPATDLTVGDAKEKSDAELFWIIKNGLSFTGMPSFGGQYDDSNIWAIVSYIRYLQQGKPAALAVPTPTAEQLAQADPAGTPAQRGAAVYFAQACQECHGPVGNGPDGLALRGGGREGAQAIRRGRRGMPAYGTDVISDADLSNLEAYMATFPGQPRGREGFGDEGGPGGGEGSESRFQFGTPN